MNEKTFIKRIIVTKEYIGKSKDKIHGRTLEEEYKKKNTRRTLNYVH